MKRTLLVLSCLLAASVMSLTAAPIAFTGLLSGGEEAPPNASPGTGFTIITIDPVLHTLRVQVDYANLIGPTVTAAHIHIINGPGDANILDTVGPVATTTPSFPLFPASVAGTYDTTFNLTLAASFRAAFITAAGGLTQAEQELYDALAEGRAYLNIHTDTFPGGEIRTFLAPIPEPSTAGLAFIAFSGLALLARKRRAQA